LKIGVTSIFPVIFVSELFEGAFQDAIFPDPEATSPIARFEFVQV
jgi:hypothetical protein